MSAKLKPKKTVFRQFKTTRNFPDEYTKLKKILGDPEDRALFFMLADATCSKRPSVDIEKIHIDVFAGQKITELEFTEEVIETLDIALDKELVKELRQSRLDAKRGNITPWDSIKVTV